LTIFINEKANCDGGVDVGGFEQIKEGVPYGRGEFVPKEAGLRKKWGQVLHYYISVIAGAYVMTCSSTID